MKLIPPILLLTFVALFLWPSFGCQRRSAEAIFPEYVQQKKEKQAKMKETNDSSPIQKQPLKFFQK